MRFIKTFPNNENCQKYREHCHYTDKYRRAAHNICNLRFNVPNEIPLVFAHLIQIMTIILSLKN